jgi:hypothetical protein
MYIDKLLTIIDSNMYDYLNCDIDKTCVNIREQYKYRENVYGRD